MALTDVAIRNAKPTEKNIRLSDEGGLYLLINTSGSKWWRYDYRYNGTRKTISMGVYPDVGLKDAREKRDASRKMLAAGIDPGENRKAQKATQHELAANSFEVICREWLGKRRDSVAPAQHVKTLARMQNDVFPWIGGKPITEIKAIDILSVLRRLDDRGARYSAHRVRSEISRAFRYAVATGRAERDPCPDLLGAIPAAKAENFAAITNPKEAAELLRAIDGFRGTFIVKSALLLAPLLFVRPGELRRAEWAAFDFEKAEWRYVVSKTKTDHLVPLATQTIALLRDLHSLTGHGRYVFPGRDPQKAMSEAAVNAALRRMGVKQRAKLSRFPG